MMAAAMALHAAAIDTMLPALPTIGRAFTVTSQNQLQWLVTIFMVGSGLGQIIYGPLTDRYGRRPVLLAGMSVFVLISLVAGSAPSLRWLLLARVLQGFAAAATSVVCRAIVRDRFVGASMARVMSVFFNVFLTAPILAPSIGQLLLLVMPWRGLFVALAVFGGSVTLWVYLRLPESLAVETRRGLSVSDLTQAAWFVISEPVSMLYTIAMTVMFGALLSYVSTVSQIFNEGFHAPHLMAAAFAFCASAMGLAAFTNSRLVERLGMRRISHTSLLLFIAITGVHVLVSLSIHEGVVLFSILQAGAMACFGLCVSNFGAIAMQPMGAIAGSAASVQGVIYTIGGALLASLIGQQWHGAITFLPLGAFCCGCVALACVLTAERGRLF